MDGKDFERYLEVKELFKERRDYDSEEYKKINDEYFKLHDEIVNILYGNKDNREKLLNKLKDSLSHYKYDLRFGDKAAIALNELKAIREILNLLDTYDWKQMYSEYDVKDENGNWITEIAVWEQNGNKQIKNHKKWTTNITCRLIGNKPLI